MTGGVLHRLPKPCRPRRLLQIQPQSQSDLHQQREANSAWNHRIHQKRAELIFKKTFQVDYIFEEKQSLRFEVWDNHTTDGDDLIGAVETSLGNIVGAKNQVCILDIFCQKSKKPRGKLIVRADKIKECSQFVWWQWTGDKFFEVFKKTPGGD